MGDSERRIVCRAAVVYYNTQEVTPGSATLEQPSWMLWLYDHSSDKTNTLYL